MEKPITVIEREYREKLINLTNDTALPTFMKKAVVKELFEALADLDRQERERAEAEWAESQKEAENAEETAEGEADG